MSAERRLRREDAINAALWAFVVVAFLLILCLRGCE